MIIILVFTEMPCKQVAEYVVSHGIVQNFVCATVLSYRNSANNFHSLCSFCLSFWDSLYNLNGSGVISLLAVRSTMFHNVHVVGFFQFFFKVRYMYKICHFYHVNVQCNGIRYIQNVVQTSPLSISKTYSSLYTETLWLLSATFPCCPPPAPGNHHSTLCLYILTVLHSSHKWNYTVLALL